MDGNCDNSHLIERIQQLEHERNELRKDIELLCMQQAGPGYLAVATRMHFQRTATLEQEIETLKKKLEVFARDKINLQEELSEAYRIKSQLADLHGAEVLKNIEAEKQIKFFQGCVAAAFSERDNSLMEAEKAKEKEELMSSKTDSYQKRIEELTLDCLEQRKLTDNLSSELSKKCELHKTLKEIVNKFYEIRQGSSEEREDISWDEKCDCLMNDSAEMWSFSEDVNKSTSRYISALEGELEASRKTVRHLQSKLQIGLEIENHLKKAFHQEKKKLQNNSIEAIKSRIAGLHALHSELRDQILELIDEEKYHLQSTVEAINGMLRAVGMGTAHTLDPRERDAPLDDDCRDVHMSSDASTSSISKENIPYLPDTTANSMGDISKVLSLALQEKVAALLLLSQQEEMHLLERNINAALQRKIDELQQSLLQVTNEKVKALMELARLKQENQVFYERIADLMHQGKHLVNAVEKGSLSNDGKGGRLKNLLKKTYLSQWIAPVESSGSTTEASQAYDRDGSRIPSSDKMDYARLMVENATLRECMDSLEHLTSSVHRHRVSLMKVNESVKGKTSENSLLKVLEDIITDANKIKTALGSSLPVSWSAEADVDVFQETTSNDPAVDAGNFGMYKLDAISAAGFEMVELILLAAQTMQVKQEVEPAIASQQ